MDKQINTQCESAGFKNQLYFLNLIVKVIKI